MKWGFPDGSVSKESACSAGDKGDIGSSLGQENPLEEAMATHSSILAWKFPWTEEPGGLQESDTTEHRAHVPHHDLALKNKVGH